MTQHEAKQLLDGAKDPATRRALMEAAGFTPPPVAASSPKIRVPKKREPNQGEAEYGRLLQMEFPECAPGYEIATLRLPSGTRYTPDWTVFTRSGLLCVEVKGAYRLGSAAASARAFKEAVAAFPQITFRHATKDENGQWIVGEYNKS